MPLAYTGSPDGLVELIPQERKVVRTYLGILEGQLESLLIQEAEAAASLCHARSQGFQFSVDAAARELARVSWMVDQTRARIAKELSPQAEAAE